MARYPDAKWQPIGYNGGTYTGGPFKIVHHTTETPTLAGALAEFKRKPYASHFLVDETQVVQLIDTDVASRALQNLAGGVQTNRDSAVQIELVAYAARPKPAAALDRVRRLCRWIEATHGVAQVWPSGYPKVAVNGRDPGGHNRSVSNWDNKSGHFGHSQTPENIHWDPAYTKEEVDFIMSDDHVHDYTEETTYVVKRGDTLTKIARLEGVTISQIVGWNKLTNPDDIIVGQVLKVRA